MKEKTINTFKVANIILIGALTGLGLMFASNTVAGNPIEVSLVLGLLMSSAVGALICVLMVQKNSLHNQIEKLEEELEEEVDN